MGGAFPLSSHPTDLCVPDTQSSNSNLQGHRQEPVPHILSAAWISCELTVLGYFQLWNYIESPSYLLSLENMLLTMILQLSNMLGAVMTGSSWCRKMQQRDHNPCDSFLPSCFQSVTRSSKQHSGLPGVKCPIWCSTCSLTSSRTTLSPLWPETRTSAPLLMLPMLKSLMCPLWLTFRVHFNPSDESPSWIFPHPLSQIWANYWIMQEH